MATSQAEREINAPQAEVWQELADFTSIASYNPFVQRSTGIDAQPTTGIGAERRCNFDPGGKKYITERITRFAEGESYDIEIYGGNQVPPVRDLVATVGVRAAGAGSSIAYMRFSYRAKRNPILWVMTKVMIAPFLARVANGVLDGLKYRVETGNEVTTAKELAAALASA